MASGRNLDPGPSSPEPHIIVRNLTMAYGSLVRMGHLIFMVGRGDVFVFMGGSASGKGSLQRHLVDHEEAAAGEILYGDVAFTKATATMGGVVLRSVGVL